MKQAEIFQKSRELLEYSN